MASCTFTLGGIPFVVLANANGKYALSFDAVPIYQFNRYKINGVKGSLVNFGDLIGYKIRAKVRYISTTPKADYVADRDALASTFPGLSVVGDDGKTYTRCPLEPGGSRIVRDPQAVGRGVAGQEFMDVEYTLVSDGG